ncbi:relaxase/mobilization nuclease domain-containing protein [Campylobacter hyointestinalis]|uniref:relaxase/mobilization nuclease domain-containing protein n=1 Tax=Campylobacter hyointestinalis TaxID=198 RepID=UPI001BD41AC7|nr:relaxase/mobilization nuclease domain-containing protein [Campylobacter hyointestinalis]MBT0612814.1 relaxase/mobilization nuclease domain-containing protein [Campylobacter hyointestinalis subsp. hyointestinalis]MDY2999663.1 relaxase/mobilization nuclease domain-containing protein [Campylobacter hyointestinalis]
MSRKLKSYLDDDFLKAKRIWSEFERKQNKYFNSPQSFKDKIWNTYILSKGFITQKFSKSEKIHTIKLLTQKRGYNPQVLIKITGTDKNFNQLKKSHIKYISRDGMLDIFINDPLSGDEIFMKNIDDIVATFRDGVYDIPSKSNLEKTKNLKEKNEVFHMVFSMKGENNIPINDIKKAAIDTIKEKFPSNHFVLAIHNDTDNPHCHLDLKSVDSNGKRIKIRPADLDVLRNEFAKKLTELGHKATNFSRKQNAFSKDKTPDIWSGHKPHHYRITGYGKAKYNFSLDEHEKKFLLC